MYIKELKVVTPTQEQTKHFPFNIDLFNSGLTFNFDNRITIYAGENACGKSTLLESLAVASGFPKQGGHRGNNLLRKTYGMNRYGEQIELDLDNVELSNNMQLQFTTKSFKGYFFRSEFMSETIQLSYATHLMTRSHGEGILELIQTSFRDGLFILDEPESALSPTSLLAMVALIHENARKYNAQYIIVTHSPILMSIPNASFNWIGDSKITPMDYKNSPHFAISKSFFDNPDRMVQSLFD